MAQRLGFEHVLMNRFNKIWVFFKRGVHFDILHDHDQFMHFKVEDGDLTQPVYANLCEM